MTDIFRWLFQACWLVGVLNAPSKGQGLPLTAIGRSRIYPDRASQVRWWDIQALAGHIGDRPALITKIHSINTMKISPDGLRGAAGGWRIAVEMKAAAASSAPGRLVLMDGSLLPWRTSSRLAPEASTCHCFLAAFDHILTGRPASFSTQQA